MKVYYLLAAIVLLIGAGAAHADTIFSVAPTPFTTFAGSAGNVLDVLLTNTGASAISIDAFSFEVSTLNPNISFTGANTSTTAAPYIFAGDSTFGPDIETVTGQSLLASDLGLVPVVVAAGAEVGLGQLLFDVPAGAASGSFPLVFTPIATSLSDPAGDAIAITDMVDGRIVIGQRSITTPEPSYVAPLAVGLLLCAARRRKTNRGVARG